MVLAAIERHWRKQPDQRLGQLLINLLRSNRDIPHAEQGAALFSVEDGQLLEWLGPETDQERRYAEDEPQQRRHSWFQQEGDSPRDRRA